MVATERSTNPVLLMKVPEVAEQTGLATSYVWRLVAQGELPVVRIGRTVRIRPVDLERFIEERLSNAA